MEDSNLKYIKTSVVVAVIGAIVCLLFDYRISIGIVVGMVSSICNYMILSSQMSMILLNQRFKVFSFVVVYLIRFSLLFIPLLLAVLRPDRCNVWAVFGSLFIFKVILYLDSFRKKVL